MKIKIFTTNNKGEIVLTKKDLEELLNEAYWEGYGNGKKYYNIYTPYYNTPYYTWTTSSGSSTITLNSKTSDSNTSNSDTITVNGGIYSAADNSINLDSYTTTATATTVNTGL